MYCSGISHICKDLSCAHLFAHDFQHSPQELLKGYWCSVSVDAGVDVSLMMMEVHCFTLKGIVKVLTIALL